jgi:hypothetical protein
MLTRRFWLPFAIVLAVAGCQDAAAPRSEANVTGLQFAVATDTSAAAHMLRQRSGAPRLETYQTSFWASPLRATTVAVNYLPAAGQSVGAPFLKFEIPRLGLMAGAGGVSLRPVDSVLITLSIDTVLFRVDFQPEGVQFSSANPAQLTMWYANADPDFNRDGQVNGLDKQLEWQLGVWYRGSGSGWSKVSSRSDPSLRFVAASIFHFCEYAISW